MTAAIAELQQAIFKTLVEDEDLIGKLGGVKIYDQVPERVALPYIVIGRTTSNDWSTSTEDGEAVTLFIHVWSRSGARTQCHELQQHLKRILHDTSQTLESNHLVALRLVFSETRRDQVSEHLHGVMRFRGVTEVSV